LPSQELKFQETVNVKSFINSFSSSLWSSCVENNFILSVSSVFL